MIDAKPVLPLNELLTPVLSPDQTVKIIGLGGVGSIVTRYGAMLLASLAKDDNARLVLIDADYFEAANEEIHD